MVSFLQMQDDILDELQDAGAITRDHVKKAILRSISEYEGEYFWFNYQKITFSTVPGQEVYGAAANALIPNIFEIETVKRVGFFDDLIPVEDDAIEESQTGAITGIPYNYSRSGTDIRLFPIPSSVETIRVSGYIKLTVLSADGDENAWTTDGETLIRQSAKRRIAMDVLYADELAARCKLAEDEAYDNLLAENRKRRGNKLLRPNAMPIARKSGFNVLVGY